MNDQAKQNIPPEVQKIIDEGNAQVVTSGPWQVTGNTIIANPPTGFMGAPSGAVKIADVRQYADAAFIVHACNAHDRLTKINEDLVAALETVAALSVDGMVTTGKPLIAAIAQARAALAKARQ